MDRNLPIPVSFPVQMASSTRAPVGGVDAGQLAAPAAGALGQVGDPQAVAPPLFGFEQGQLGAGVGPFPAGVDSHRGWPARQLVTGPSEGNRIS
jgi:hypothetical protein